MFLSDDAIIGNHGYVAKMLREKHVTVKKPKSESKKYEIALSFS